MSSNLNVSLLARVLPLYFNSKVKLKSNGWLCHSFTKKFNLPPNKSGWNLALIRTNGE